MRRLRYGTSGTAIGGLIGQAITVFLVAVGVGACVPVRDVSAYPSGWPEIAADRSCTDVNGTYRNRPLAVEPVRSRNPLESERLSLLVLGPDRFADRDKHMKVAEVEVTWNPSSGNLVAAAPAHEVVATAPWQCVAQKDLVLEFGGEATGELTGPVSAVIRYELIALTNGALLGHVVTNFSTGGIRETWIWFPKN